MHRAQKTDGVKALLKKKNTELVTVPPGCTSRVQPLDVSFNTPFLYKQSIFDPRTENCLSFSKKLPPKSV